MSEFGCLKEGYLIKQGQNVKSWRKRFFLLQTNVLYYFKSDKDTTSKGFILFKDIIRIDERRTESHPNIIAIVCRNRTLLLSIDNVVEASSWAQVLRIIFRFYSFQFTYSGGGGLTSDETPSDKSLDLSFGNTTPTPSPFPPALSPPPSSDAPQPPQPPQPSSSATSSQSSLSSSSAAAAAQESKDITTDPSLSPQPTRSVTPTSSLSASSSSLPSSSQSTVSTASTASSAALQIDVINTSQSSIWCHSDEYLRKLFDYGRKVLELIVQANGYIRGISSYRKNDKLRGDAMLLGSLGTRLAACLIDLTKAPFSAAKKIEICKVCGEIVTMNDTVRTEAGEAALLRKCLDKMEEYIRMIVAANPPPPEEEIMLVVKKAMLAAEAIVPDKARNKELVASLNVPKRRAVSTLKRMIDGGNGLLWIGNRFSAVCEGVATSFIPETSSDINVKKITIVEQNDDDENDDVDGKDEKDGDAAVVSKSDVDEDDISFIQDMKQLTQLAKESYNTFIVLGNSVMQSRVVKTAGSASFDPLDLIKDTYVAQCKERFAAYMETILDVGTRNFKKKT